MLNRLRRFMLNVRESVRMYPVLTRLHDCTVYSIMEQLKKAPCHNEPRSLIPHSFRVYSQFEEDGIISAIFDRIGTTSNAFVEFGVEDGTENNTLALLFQGWNGLWIEASERLAAQIRKQLPRTISSGRLRVENAFVTRDNIDELLADVVKAGDIDLLSIDIDSNDVHVFNAITCVRPRVVAIEYNAKFPPPVRYCMEYSPQAIYHGDDCHGASLQFLEESFRDKGYALVGCDLAGANAFFVRKDLTQDRFLKPFSAERHYQPARYFLSCLRAAHKPSLRTLDTSLTPTTDKP